MRSAAKYRLAVENAAAVESRSYRAMTGARVECDVGTPRNPPPTTLLQRDSRSGSDLARQEDFAAAQVGKPMP